MDDLAFLRARIESYADYTNDDACRLTDREIRAYTGEALSDLAERLQPDGTAAATLAQLLERCEFADQLVVRAFDTAVPDAAELSALHAADRAIVELAQRAQALATAGVADYLVAVGTALDARARIITNTADTPRLPPR